MHPEKTIPHKISRPFQHKVDYNYSQSDNHDFVRRLYKEQEYKEYGGYKEVYSMVNK